MDKDPDMLWTMAPKPTMDDSMYNLNFPWDEKSDERKNWIDSYKFQTNETQPVSKRLIVFVDCSLHMKYMIFIYRLVLSPAFRYLIISMKRVSTSLRTIFPLESRYSLIFTSYRLPVNQLTVHFQTIIYF